MTIYTVRSGDSLYTIARRFGVTAQSIAQDNLLTAPDNLVVGQTLVILNPIRTYTTIAGDDIYSIAQKAGISVNQLLRNNPVLGGGGEIPVGTTLNIE